MQLTGCQHYMLALQMKGFIFLVALRTDPALHEAI